MEPATIPAPETTTTDDLGTDDTYTTWCDEHRDAWIAASDADETH
ncbi:MAG TPA: hypothetical protein VFV33_14180 [Gemmatimonadaceae bacterium]|nr:hypothetical protein [Gemmatimonadaceae bacterium]